MATSAQNSQSDSDNRRPITGGFAFAERWTIGTDACQQCRGCADRVWKDESRFVVEQPDAERSTQARFWLWMTHGWLG